LNISFSQALFQGAYSVLVTFIPISQLKVGIKAVGNFQVAASAGIVLAFALVWRFQKCFSHSFAIGTGAITGILMLLVISRTELLYGSLISFFLLNLGYETVWLSSSSAFFSHSPANRTAQFQFTLTASASFLMSTFALGFALAIKQFGLTNGVSIVTMFAVSLLLLLKLLHYSHSKAVGIESKVK
jgi:hypothetical protein